MPKKQHNAKATQMLELASSITKNLPKNISSKVAKEWISNLFALATAPRSALMPPMYYSGDMETRGFKILSD